MATLSPPMSPQQTRSSDRPRAVSSMSYASTQSHRSSKSREEKKLELTESPRDKRRLEGKSDPTKALSEAQPAAVALEDSSMDNLRAMQHKDKEGNPIADPDRSNPTRPRMERPLDTIRSFAAAAEGTTTRRSSYQRQPSQSGWDAQSRRSSYYGTPNSVYSPNGRPGPRPPVNGPGGYYNNNNNMNNRNNNSYNYNMRPEAYAEDGQPMPPRQQKFQAPPFPMQHGESPNSMHSGQPSYETMTSGSDEMSKSTNPSSNSSYDQLHHMGMRKQENGYDNNPYRQFGGPMRNPYPPSAMPNGFASQQQQYPSGPTDDYGIEFSNAAPPPPPKIFNNRLRDTQPPPVNGGRLQKINSGDSQREQPKRQSWIKRTFSKRA